MGWSSGESLAAEVIGAAWPGIRKLKARERREFLLKVVDLFIDHDAEFCWGDWTEDDCWTDLRKALIEDGRIEDCCGEDECEDCYGLGWKYE